MEKDYQSIRLENGIRLVHQTISSPVAHCGIIVNTGSRDEEEDQHGMAHFVEHMVFKGTKRRRAHHILSRMEDIGGEINAYTTKEETCLFTGFFNNYYQRAFDLLADILFFPEFPLREIAKEKDVIIDEINSYKDSPLELIYDEFEEIAFHPHPIGRNILGTEESLNQYTREQLFHFIGGNYPTDQMVVSSVSSLSFKKVEAYFRRFFEDIPEKQRPKTRPAFVPVDRTEKKFEQVKNTYQAHCVMGALAYNNKEDKRFPLHLLNNLLGGPGMNSRLNMSLRERKGLAYNVESHYNTYSDAGLLQIYFGTDHKDLNRSMELTLKELNRFRTKALGSLQIARAKRQLIGQVAMSAENHENQMIGNGRSLLLFDHIESLRETTERIDAIRPGDILEVANEILNPENIFTLIYR